MIYRFIDGKTFNANTTEELVIQIRDSSYNPGSTLESFMNGMAKRADIMEYGQIRTDTIDHFIEDLLSHEIITLQTMH